MKRADRLRANRRANDKYLEEIMKSLGLLTVTNDCGVVPDIEPFLKEAGVGIEDFIKIKIARVIKVTK